LCTTQFLESLIRAFPLIEVSIRTSSRKLRSVLDVFYQAVKTGEESNRDNDIEHKSSVRCTALCYAQAKSRPKLLSGLKMVTPQVWCFCKSVQPKHCWCMYADPCCAVPACVV
jgi:hypothetical protein